MVRKKSSDKPKSIQSLEQAYLEEIHGSQVVESPVAEQPSDPTEQMESLIGDDLFVSSESEDREKIEQPTGDASAAVDDDWQGLEVKVSSDAMKVVLRSERGCPVTEERILQELKKKRIVHGIDRKAVSYAVRLLQEQEGWQGEVTVARGTPPEKPKMSLPFLKKVIGEDGKDAGWLVEGESLSFEALKGVFEITDVRKIAGLNFSVKAVQTGEILASLTNDAKAGLGQNVFGVPVKQTAMRFLPGKNVNFNNKNGQQQYESMAYGYLYMEGERISVLPPLWVSPDHMGAFFIHLPQVGVPKYPSEQEIRAFLTLAGVKEGYVDNTALKQLCEKLKAGSHVPVASRIAVGNPPRPGRDARLHLCFDTEIKAGRLLENNSIDFRERNTVTGVREGTLIAEKIQETNGINGLTIFGEKIQATDGRELVIYTNDGVTHKQDGEKILYYAKKGGNVSYNETRRLLSVVDLFHVDGDIDYETGNIEVATDLLVSGSVAPGFTVKADGNIHINGMIESGSMVTARGDLSVGGGILGEKTKVIVFGALRTGFIQDAEVIAKDDVTVRQYIFNSTVRSGGTITVLKQAGSRGGMVVGGIVCASKGIQLSTVGSPTNRNTVVALQSDPELGARLNKISSEIKQATENIVKMMRTLQLETIDPAQIRTMIAALPEGKKALYIKILDTLNKFIKQRNMMTGEEQQLKEEIDRRLGQATIRVTNEFFQGNEVQIGSSKYVAQSDLGPTIFRLEDGKIVT